MYEAETLRNQVSEALQRAQPGSTVVVNLWPQIDEQSARRIVAPFQDREIHILPYGSGCKVYISN